MTITAEVLAGVSSLDDALAFLTDNGFELRLITPADDPAEAVLERDGLRVRISTRIAPTNARLRVQGGTAGETTLTGPDGIVLDLVAPAATGVPALVEDLAIARLGGDASWVIGRGDMRYRDLIPSRLGGRFIASHIEVSEGGPVPDRVHHHAIRFQLIVCQQGWVDVVYEDQGPPFRMTPGDAVLQPPHIRHRVLESSAGARVVEIGCPAEHDTLFDPATELPTTVLDPERDFGGQRFVRHQGANTQWHPARFTGFEHQVSEVASATDGLADVRFLRPVDPGAEFATTSTADEFHLVFVLAGTAAMTVAGESFDAVEGDSVTLPVGTAWGVRDAAADLRLLEVTLPG